MNKNYRKVYFNYVDEDERSLRKYLSAETPIRIDANTENMLSMLLGLLASVSEPADEVHRFLDLCSTSRHYVLRCFA